MKLKFINYYNPNYSFKSLLRLVDQFDQTNNVEGFFKAYTGKKYILATFSCRSALYLTYKALSKKGEVITSPLTCLTSILPITYSGNNPVFIDIERDTLNINADLIEEKISGKTTAIQVIHLAGYPCEMEKISEISEKYNLPVIEDCAQSFGAKYKGKNVGSFGDVSCFSLAKNLYGIAGGILATDNLQIYQEAKKIQQEFKKASSLFLYYRFLRNYLKSKSDQKLFRLLHKKLIDLKDRSKSKQALQTEEELETLTNYLRKPDKKIFNISWSQIQKLESLHKARNQKGNIYLDKISGNKNIRTPENRNDVERSFVKFYVSGNFNSQKDIRKLNKLGIEAKHLEEEFGVYYQERFDKNSLLRDNDSLKSCDNYLDIHDSLISLPLSENLTEEEIEFILKALIDLNKT